jgi:hypothetical protein
LGWVNMSVITEEDAVAGSVHGHRSVGTWATQAPPCSLLRIVVRYNTNTTVKTKKKNPSRPASCVGIDAQGLQSRMEFKPGPASPNDPSYRIATKPSRTVEMNIYALFVT